MIAVCPQCDCALVVLSWRGLEVDVCPVCHGIWLDSGELEELISRAGAQVDDPLLALQGREGHLSRSSRRLICPRCDQRLREVSAYGSGDTTQVRVDKCSRGHGLWFEEGELRALLRSCTSTCGATGTVEVLAELLGPGTTKLTEEC